MELLLLGTAAAEAWPCPWCGCSACTEAQRRGGRDIRTRAGALLDGCVKIDFGPDTLMQMQREHRTLRDVTTLVFTHGHDDHFTPTELQYRGPGSVTQSPLPLMHVYANAEIGERLREIYGDKFAEMHMELHPPLEPFQPVTTADGTEILPQPAAHSPGALLLRLTRHGRSVFQGHDSGVYPEETIAALGKAPLHLALFDCTYGPTPYNYHGHLGIPGVIESAERLRRVGAITEQTTLVATHFSHNGGALYDELVTAFAPHGIRVAADGMIFDV
jgi:phosphoribosyl 1,2-cyclic phosphate phosphodiesterase